MSSEVSSIEHEHEHEHEAAIKDLSTEASGTGTGRSWMFDVVRREHSLRSLCSLWLRGEVWG